MTAGDSSDSQLLQARAFPCTKDRLRTVSGSDRVVIYYSWALISPWTSVSQLGLLKIVR